LESLPIVVIDDEIIKTGAYLTVEELEKITDIGISVQKE
ncbi:arsenic metallochaperone ArsD family protein, partial [Enterococcus durans]|nr:arsenic metallochaperone ArsD family protein [Enterococcus durans]